MARIEARKIKDCRLFASVLHAESEPPLCQLFILALLPSYVCVSTVTDLSHGESVLFHWRGRAQSRGPCITLHPFSGCL